MFYQNRRHRHRPNLIFPQRAPMGQRSIRGRALKGRRHKREHVQRRVPSPEEVRQREGHRILGHILLACHRISIWRSRGQGHHGVQGLEDRIPRSGVQLALLPMALKGQEGRVGVDRGRIVRSIRQCIMWCMHRSRRHRSRWPRSRWHHLRSAHRGQARSMRHCSEGRRGISRSRGKDGGLIRVQRTRRGARGLFLG